MSTLWEMLGEPFIWTGFTAAAFTAVVCAYLGVFVIWKRIVFVSVALAETAGLGVALGYFLGLHPQVTPLLLTTAAILFFWHYLEHRHTQRESMVGLVYCLAGAVAIILIAKNPLAHAHGLDIISGNFLYARRPEILNLAFICGLVMLVQLSCEKEFVSVAFDRDFARSTGIKTKSWEFLFYLSLGLAISFTMRISGLIFVFGSLLVPALTGLLLGQRTGRIFLISVIFALAGTLLGFVGSYYWDLPTSPFIVAVYGGGFILCALVKRIAADR